MLIFKIHLRIFEWNKIFFSILSSNGTNKSNPGTTFRDNLNIKFHYNDIIGNTRKQCRTSEPQNARETNALKNRCDKRLKFTLSLVFVSLSLECVLETKFRFIPPKCRFAATLRLSSITMPAILLPLSFPFLSFLPFYLSAKSFWEK